MTDSDIVKRLRAEIAYYKQLSLSEMEAVGKEIERLRNQLAAAISINRRLVDEVERLTAKREAIKKPRREAPG